MASEPGVRDHDRSISESGAACARKVAHHLKDLQWLPDLLLCSSSKRTQQTVDVMAQVCLQNGTSLWNAGRDDTRMRNQEFYCRNLTVQAVLMKLTLVKPSLMHLCTLWQLLMGRQEQLYASGCVHLGTQESIESRI